MTVGIQFELKCGDKTTAKLDVIFIHGITGDAIETWSNSKAAFWPSWLLEELPEICVYTAGYPSSLFEKWAKKEMDLHARASSLLEHMVSAGIGKRPIVFVCHSLGGIIVKEMFRAAVESQDEDWIALSAQLKLVAFLATPHKGADIAAILKFIVPRFSSKFIDTLSGDSGYLANLNNSYRDLAGKHDVTSIAYYETYKTKGVALIVTADSADPGALKTRPIPVDSDHIGICKLESKDAPVFLSLLRHLKKVCDSCPSLLPQGSGEMFGPYDYTERASHDRRTLQEKLIDAGREYEYPKANELQNKFARDYHRMGLFTEAKRKNDDILAAVEQRFLTHVFGPMICNGAPEAEIAKAIQQHVIDPLCSGSGHEAMSPKAILQAIYYLTEQCHIQWDKP